MLPSGDFYLCKRCYDRAIDFVGDPTIHHWKTVQVEIAGLTADSTYVVERCRICGDLRVDEDTEVVEWTGADARESMVEPIPDAEMESAGHDGDRQNANAKRDDATPERAVHEPYRYSSSSADR